MWHHIVHIALVLVPLHRFSEVHQTLFTMESATSMQHIQGSFADEIHDSESESGFGHSEPHLPMEGAPR